MTDFNKFCNAAYEGNIDYLRQTLEANNKHINEVINSTDLPLTEFPLTDCTSLHLAAYSGHTDTVQLLLQHGANPTMSDRKSKTALDYSIQNNHPQISNIIISHLSHEQRNSILQDTISQFNWNLYSDLQTIYLTKIQLLSEHGAVADLSQEPKNMAQQIKEAIEIGQARHQATRSTAATAADQAPQQKPQQVSLTHTP